MVPKPFDVHFAEKYAPSVPGFLIIIFVSIVVIAVSVGLAIHFA